MGEAEETASRVDWTLAEVAACTDFAVAAAAAVVVVVAAGARPVRQPWPRRVAAGQTGSLLAAWRLRSRSAVESVSQRRRGR